MKIVIDIPEEVYEGIMDGTENTWDALDLILKSKILPKGCGRLVDADKLAVAIAMIRDGWNDYGNEYESTMFRAYDNCVDEIIDAPTIIEAEEEIGE